MATFHAKTSQRLCEAKPRFAPRGCVTRVKTISRLPIPYHEKATFIRASALSAAKYGTQAVHVGGACLCALTAAIVETIARN